MKKKGFQQEKGELSPEPSGREGKDHWAKTIFWEKEFSKKIRVRITIPRRWASRRGVI